MVERVRVGALAKDGVREERSWLSSVGGLIVLVESIIDCRHTPFHHQHRQHYHCRSSSPVSIIAVVRIHEILGDKCRDGPVPGALRGR